MVLNYLSTFLFILLQPKAARSTGTVSLLEPAVSIEEYDASNSKDSSVLECNDSSNWDERSIDSIDVKEELIPVATLNGSLKRPPPLQYMEHQNNKHARLEETNNFSSNISISMDPQETSDSGMSRASIKKDDLYDAFGKYVASLLRELGSPESLQAQQEITALIFTKLGSKSSSDKIKERQQD